MLWIQPALPFVWRTLNSYSHWICIYRIALIYQLTSTAYCTLDGPSPSELNTNTVHIKNKNQINNLMINNNKHYYSFCICEETEHTINFIISSKWAGAQYIWILFVKNLYQIRMNLLPYTCENYFLNISIEISSM